ERRKAAAGPAAAMATRTTGPPMAGRPSCRAHPFKEALPRTRLQERGLRVVDVGAETTFDQEAARLALEQWLFRTCIEHRQPRIAIQRRRAWIATNGSSAQQLRHRRDACRGIGRRGHGVVERASHRAAATAPAP